MMSEQKLSRDAERWSQPANLFDIVPYDKYRYELVKFKALKQLGYPVELKLKRESDLPKDLYPTDDFFNWCRRQYPQWVCLIFDDPGLELFVGELTGFNARAEGLEDHLAQVIFEVDIVLVTDIAARLDAVSARERPPLVLAPEEHKKALQAYQKKVDFLEGCFVASFNRFLEYIQKGAEMFSDNLVPPPSEFMRYRDLMARGVKPVMHSELLAVATDYYQQLETLDPEFAAFKKRQA